jgi:cytoskeletal protein CcmA (bactofilin family)
MAWFDRSPGGKRSPSEEQPERAAIPTDAGEPIGAAEPGSTETSSEELVAHLFKGSRVTGQLTFHGPAIIEGNVEGEVLCHGILTIGRGAEVRAKITGEIVIVRGTVEGDVAAKKKVELEDSARLFGNIQSPRLVVTEGVLFDGDCSMRGAREKVEEK